MRLHSLLLLGIALISFVASAVPSLLPLPTTPLLIDSITDLWNQSSQHQKQLEFKKNQLLNYSTTTTNNNNNPNDLQAHTKLEEFILFQQYMHNILKVYTDTIHSTTHDDNHDGDFKNEAFQLTFDFQNQLSKLKSSPSDLPSDLPLLPVEQQQQQQEEEEEEEYLPPSQLNQAFQEVLKEVSENADHLEEGIHNKNRIDANQVNIETVLKLEEDNEDVVTLLDQEHNEYILMRPSDTTVIIEDAQLIYDVIFILVVSFVFGWFFSLIYLPAFFGYILAGILIGPANLNLVQELIQVETLAQLGVVLIIFVLGLEFSIEKLKKMWKLAVGGAVTLLLVIMAVFVLLGCCIGASVKESIFVGACVSLSSTAVVAKCINLEQFDHLYGLLVMQDVILGFMLAMIPALSKSGTEIFLAVLKLSISFTLFGGICFGLMKLIPLVPPVVKQSMSAILDNNELMLLGTLTICMSLLALSQWLGLGMEIGCFAAGMLLRSERSLSKVEPVRDLFSCLFFASIGLHIYPSFLVSEAALLLGLSIGIITFKYIATCMVLYLFKLDIFRSSKMAIALAQVSEFGFVLASRAKQLDIISRELYYVILAVTSITLIATPLLLKLSCQNVYQPIEESPTPTMMMTNSEKFA